MARLEGPSSIRYRPLHRAGNEVRLLELQRAATNDVNERVVCRLVHEKLIDSSSAASTTSAASTSSVGAAASPPSDFIALSTLLGDMTVTETVQINGSRVALPGNVVEALRFMRTVFLAPSPPTPSSSTADFHQTQSESSSTHYQPAPAPPPASATPKKTPGWLRSLFKNVRSILAEPPESGGSGSGSRGGNPPLRIWIDLLCINRRDAREEAEKRSHMAKAYRSARMVVGWLGPKDDTSDLAIDIIRQWNACMPATFGEPGDREVHPDDYAPVMQWMGPVAHLSDIPPGITDPRDVPSYKAISGFLDRPYFRNAWILEDMAMARFPAFLLGDDIISWMEVLRLNRVNEDIKDNGAAMFPDELRHLLEYMPLGSVHAFLQEFEMRQRQHGITPAMLLAGTGSMKSSIKSSAASTAGDT